MATKTAMAAADGEPGWAVLGFAVTGLVLGTPLLFVVLIFGGLAIDAFVLTKLWGWLAVPAFGVRPIGIAAAAVALVLWQFVRAKPSGRLETKDKTTVQVVGVIFGELIGRPAVHLGVGYAVHLAHVWGYIAF
jgi:hypothetical protein